MTLDEVDAELAQWKKTLGAAAQNLMDLHSLPTYQRLAGSNGVPKADLEGETAARVYPALDGMGRLFENFDALQSTIGRAAELRESISPIFGSDGKLRELQELLRGKSVQIPGVAVPIQQRSLLTAEQNVERITPADLMGLMARSFTAARDVVLAVHAAWEKLGMALDRAVTELAACGAECARWKANVPALAKAQAALNSIQNRIERDPLTAANEFDVSVMPGLNEARAALTRLNAQRGQIGSGLSAARRQMEQLTEVHEKCLASWEERRLKVTSAAEPPAPGDEAQIGTLREWLGRLEEKFGAGMLDPIAVGLKNWNTVASKCVSDERAALDANQAPVMERNELRGRLDALKAKARARGYAEDSELTRIAAQATQLLFTRPTPIEKASALVIDYEHALRAQSGAQHDEDFR